MAQVRAEDVPASLKMLHQGLGFVLRQNNNFVYSGVDAVGQGQVNKQVNAPERDGRLGSAFGQRHQPFAFASSHNHRKGILHLLQPPHFLDQDLNVLIPKSRFHNIFRK